jgi:thymidine phosphorylase
MVAAQGGRLDAPRPIAPAHDLCGDRSGVVESIDTETLGWIIIDLGGGRRQLTDPIDHSVGLETLVRIGDEVAPGQLLVRVFAPQAKFDEVAARLRAAITIGDDPTESPLLIAERLG